MNKRLRILSWLVVTVFGIFFAIGISFVVSAGGTPWQDAPEIDEVVNNVSVIRESRIKAGEKNFGDESEINILLLGLDGRKGAKAPHCDAIHMFSLNVEDWTITVTSVPRGTFATLPIGGDYLATDYYLANACAFGGLDYGVSQIERIVGKKADYRVTVGFSQVLGILRLFDMPTTESLQWLRHRQSYAIGDPQRSRNQAVFMKDLLLKEGARFKSEAARPLFYVLFSIADTDMDFGTAWALMRGFQTTNITNRPDDITLQMKPFYETQDLHLDFENPDEQIEKIINYLKPYLSKEDLSLRSLDDVQDELIAFIEESLDGDDDSDLYDQRLWLQIEDPEKREELQFRFVKRHVLVLMVSDRDEAIDILTAYIIEKDTIGEEWSAKEGRALMDSVIQ